MATILFGCGCSITASMFGDREIHSAITCMKHSLHEDIQPILQALSNKLEGILSGPHDGEEVVDGIIISRIEEEAVSEE